VLNPKAVPYNNFRATATVIFSRCSGPYSYNTEQQQQEVHVAQITVAPCFFWSNKAPVAPKKNGATVI